MKLIKNTLTCLAFISLIFTACNSNGQIVGTWEENVNKITDTRWTFYEDNSFTMAPKLELSTMRKMRITGTYEIKGEKIYLRYRGKETIMNYEKNGNNMKIGTDAGGYYELTKVN